MRWWGACGIAGVLVLWSVAGAAHPLAPALLELRETGGGRADVTWKTSRLLPRGVHLRPLLPEACHSISEPTAREEARSVTLHWSVDCGDGGLVGGRVFVEGLPRAKIEVLARIALYDGRVVNKILRAREPGLTIPPRQARSRVLADYLTLGVEHILTGPDHLLFVFALLLVVGGARRLVKTITAFTLGHSLTVTLVVLGIATVPAGAAELLIAGSILMLAVESARLTSARPGPMRRSPWLVAVAFGLLHGMGFASALTRVGLPPEEIPLALVAFNLGIELGQLIFLAIVLDTRRLLRLQPVRVPWWLARAPSYAIGSLAAFWCLERGAALF